MKALYTIFLLFPIILFSQAYPGTVLFVIDGDTFVFQTGQESVKVRMNGIDAPEKDQSVGNESTVYLEKYLKKPATLKTRGTDKYGRTLGTLFVDGKDINLEMVRSGNAWHYKKYSKDILYSAAEDSARIEKIGLWKDSNPIAPWDWRLQNN